MNIYDKNMQYAVVENWHLIKSLGSGGTSRVFLGYEPVTQKTAAIKIMKCTDAKTLAYVENEVRLQLAISSPYVLRIDGYYETAPLVDASSKTHNITMLVLEHAPNGDILSLIEKIRMFPEKLARTYLHQLIAALECTHRAQIAHRDIKPDNIMLDKDYCIKISDFGCAAKYSSSKPLFTSPAGTSKYFPPEVLAGMPYEGQSVDLFATAILLFCLIVGHMPFSSATEKDPLYSMLINGKAKNFWKSHEGIIREERGEKIILNADFKDLLTKMLDSTPSKRLTFEGIKKSAWYKGPTLERAEVGKFIVNLLDKKMY